MKAQVHLRDDDGRIGTRARGRERHERLGLAEEIDRPVVGPAGARGAERRRVGQVLLAADRVERLARNAQLLAALRVELRVLGDRRREAQQADRVDAAVVARERAGRRLCEPADLALDLADELGDLRGCGVGLLALDRDQQSALLRIGEPRRRARR